MRVFKRDDVRKLEVFVNDAKSCLWTVGPIGYWPRHSYYGLGSKGFGVGLWSSMNHLDRQWKIEKMYQIL